MTKETRKRTVVLALVAIFDEGTIVRSRIPATIVKAHKVIRTAVLATCLLLSLMTGCGSAVIGNADANNTNKAGNSPTVDSRNAESLPSDLSKVLTVTYCDLTRNPTTYDRRIVRLRAVYFNGFERMFLYDEICEIGKPPQAPKTIPAEMWVEWDKNYRTKESSPEATKYQETKPEERKDVTLIGRFNATREMNNTGSGRYLFQIMRVEKVVSVHSNSADSY